MTIHNREAYMASLPDWSMLDGCFGGTRIKPTDIDGCVERRGRVLFLEHKSTPTASLTRGQDILFTALADSGHAAIVFWSEGTERNVQKMRVYWRGKTEDRDPASLTDLRAAVSRWFVYADSKKAA